MDPEVRALADRLSSYRPADRYILFEFDVTSAATTKYLEGTTDSSELEMERLIG